MRIADPRSPQAGRPAPDAGGETLARTADRKLLATGAVGAGVVALCCFTPVLAVLLGVVGLSAALGWLDYVLLPALAFFIALTAYAVWRRQRRVQARQDGSRIG